ncbi:tetratricopeptide repeat protein [Ideonella sp. YS5]|uniref:tetratricopeptide repeat protein n=1 Tax=Ideonella sp. YS5 TaxID=3453714 RepID=UPI003F71DD9D
MLGAGLNAYRRGSLGELPERHTRLRRLLQERWLAGVTHTLGDALPAPRRTALSLLVLMRWGLSQLRPDQSPGLEGIEEHAWLASTSWRPLLAIACHHGFLPVPSFPSRYHRRADESPIENLCGLWAIGHSTLYRYLDKGRRQLIDVFADPAPTGIQRLQLRRAAHAELRALFQPEAGWQAWHGAQARTALMNGGVADALWHFWQAGDFGGLFDALHHHGTEVAGSPESDALLEAVEVESPLSPAERFELALRRAQIWRYRHDSVREEEALRRGLRQAHDLADPLRLGVAHAAIARFHETRDRDRAFACYEEAVEHLRRVLSETGHPERMRAVQEYASCVVRLAWLHLRRNNPRAKALLDQAQQLGREHDLPGDILAPLEQTWGEYWRCLGDTGRALEHKHKALIVYERLGDQRAVLNTYRNLSLIYGEARDFERALDYGRRVIDAAREMMVEPDVLAGAHGNLGVAYFYLGQLDQAIDQYQEALRIEETAGLRAHLGASHYNLAEAYYKRFQHKGQRDDEVLGDRHAAMAARLSAEDNTPGLGSSVRTLKEETLGTSSGPDRLIPVEYAAHFEEMADIQRLRTSLAMPQGAAQQVRAHLAIARAYLAIAAKERESALALAQRHGLQEDFGPELDALRQAFTRDLTREQRLSQTWAEHSDDLLRSDRRQLVLAHVLAQGSINKSTYAEVAVVSLATASKHLGLLAERGLLVQTGKGPSTRYLLADGPVPNRTPPILGMPAPGSAF